MKNSMRKRSLMTVALVTGVLVSLPASAQHQLTTLQKRLLSGAVSLELEQHQARLQTGPSLAGAAANVAASSSALSFFPLGPDQCDNTIGGTNFKVNQNCVNVSDSDLQGRAQAANETSLAQDPNNPRHLVAAYNDYRFGDAFCGTSYSVDGGQTWHDSLPPQSFVRGASFGGVDREYWQAGSDPSVAWDTKGNVYLSCLAFQRGPGVTNNPDQSSVVNVFRSTQSQGASWNFPGRAVALQFTTAFVPTLDKEYLTVDNHVGSPFQDRVYVTYTLFGADGSANIFVNYSADYGETFSAPILVSGSSTLCPNSVTTSGNCDLSAFSNPFTGPDGALYVVFNNFNNAVTGNDNRNQVLLAKSTDGGVSFGSLVKVADYYDLPDCATYQGGQDLFRACLPEKGSNTNSVFRAANYPSGAADPQNAKIIAVTFGSYINVHSSEANGCVPAGFSSTTGQNFFTGVKTVGACNNDILVSVSTNGGASFTGTTTDPRTLTSVTHGQDLSDQFWQWSAFTPAGVLAVSYYDRSYGSDETTGSMDVSAAWSRDLSHFHTTRATSSSMPLPTQFPDDQGNSVFFGDYSGLAALDRIHPLWMDTRHQDRFLCPGTGAPGSPPLVCAATEPNGLTANTQDIYTTAVANED